MCGSCLHAFIAAHLFCVAHGTLYSIFTATTTCEIDRDRFLLPRASKVIQLALEPRQVFAQTASAENRLEEEFISGG